MVTFEVPGRSVPCARHRTTKGGRTYVPRPTIQHEAAIAWTALAADVALTPERRYSLEMDFHGASPRADLDNLVKTVLDGLQRGYPGWNDSQVVRLIANKRDEGPPRTVVRIREALS